MAHKTKHDHINSFFIYGLSVCFIITLSLTYRALHFFEKKKPTPIEVVQKPVSKEIFNKAFFGNLHIEGRAYVVYDLLNHEVISAKNETVILPLASLTKLMMAVSSTMHAPQGAKVTITSKSIEDGYDLGLHDNQVWLLPELLKYTLVFSSNDGAQAVADRFGGSSTFVRQMNDDAKAFGLNFIFTDPAGRDMDGKIGGKGDALDAALLLEVARKQIPDILDATTKKRQTVLSSTGKIIGIPNTNQEIETLPGAEGSKTGFTDLAGGNLGVIVDISIGHPVAIVVLGSTREGRFRDITALYTALRKSLVNK